MDLTEVFEAGYSVDDIKVTIGYCESGMDVEIRRLLICMTIFIT